MTETKTGRSSERCVPSPIQVHALSVRTTSASRAASDTAAVDTLRASCVATPALLCFFRSHRHRAAPCPVFCAMIFVAAAGIVVTTTVVVGLAVAAQAKSLLDSQRAATTTQTPPTVDPAAGGSAQTSADATGKAEDVKTPLLGGAEAGDVATSALQGEVLTMYQAH